MKIARCIANVVITLLLGDLLARQIASLLYAEPGVLASIRQLLIRVRVLQPDTQYDISGPLLLLILLTSIAVVGVVVWLLNVGVRRHRKTLGR